MEFVLRYLQPWTESETQVAAPYVNHVATMTGGVGFQDLSRFYKASAMHLVI